jgi:predicted double-glycine peptidase
MRIMRSMFPDDRHGRLPTPRRRGAAVLVAVGLGLAGCAGDAAREPNGLAHLSGKTWMEMRFADMIAQKEDYTCGAASLATLLTHYYGLDVSEADVLDVAERDSGNKLALTEDAEAESVDEARAENVKIEGFTYADLARFSGEFGFAAKGIKTDYPTLLNLKRPVIAYLEGDGFNHFVVIRQVTTDWVYVSDPTWGNRRYVRGMFEKLWAIDRGEDGKRLGRILAVLPGGQRDGLSPEAGFFNPI